MFTKEELQAISDAIDIATSIENLLVLQDALLKPVVEAHTKSSNEEIRELIHMLPAGFYKTELRLMLLSRLENIKQGRNPWSE